MTAPTQVFAAHNILFQDISLLTLALTHASKNRDANNERLEFLGDRVLGLVLADRLYRRYPQETEGELALRHAALVKADMLAGVARTLSLDAALDLSARDRAAGTGSLENVLADGLEALIGALYLDQGMDVCAALIGALWVPLIEAMALPPQDPKTALQEWAQARGLPLPVYTLATRTGPDHAPVFEIEVSVKGTTPTRGSGPTRRAAEKIAAQVLLDQLRGQE